jgi:hypothetical protein
MKTLKELVNMSETAKGALEAMALRGRHRREPWRISRFKAKLNSRGVQARIDDLIDLLKELEALKEGTIVYGRNKQPVRFNFARPIYTIGQEAIGEERYMELKGQPLPVVVKKPSYLTQPVKEVILILPDHRKVQIQLPSNMSLQELKAALS